MRRAGKVAGFFLMGPPYTGQTGVGKNMLAFQISSSAKETSVFPHPFYVFFHIAVSPEDDFM